MYPVYPPSGTLACKVSPYNDLLIREKVRFVNFTKGFLLLGHFRFFFIIFLNFPYSYNSCFPPFLHHIAAFCWHRSLVYFIHKKNIINSFDRFWYFDNNLIFFFFLPNIVIEYQSSNIVIEYHYRILLSNIIVELNCSLSFE
jgi:hypothetical protein